MTLVCLAMTYLFDIYSTEDLMYLWLIDDQQRLVLVTDVYYPVIYAEGPDNLLEKLVARLYELEALFQEPRWVTKRHFYKNEPTRVLELTIARPSVLWRIKSKLFALIRKLDIYHSDIEPVVSYLYSKGLYPLAPVAYEAEIEGRRLVLKSIRALRAVTDFDYEIPPLRILTMNLAHSHRLGMGPQNPLQLEASTMPLLTEATISQLSLGEAGFSANNTQYEIGEKDQRRFIRILNHILKKENPDVIVSSYGDQVIFPALFSWGQKHKMPLELDRDQVPPTSRKIIKKGTSFNTYGSWIFRAPSYPLFGRWHIDSRNSFTYKETQLLGIIELSRLSRLPAQRLARASTGGALTNMEMAVAIEQDYLVPWQKSALENEKTWYELHLYDKGGLVYQPDIEEGNLKENIVQLDFSQMYPSIMNIHNISPETVNCLCCQQDDVPQVPEIGFKICNRRRGIVSDTLGHVLERRAHYKERKKVTTGFEKEWNQTKIDSLKWVNVVSFGYLGYRNAKFGKIESHESVTAFGRDKLLEAVRLAEGDGFKLSHAITDCIFVHKDGAPLDYGQLDDLCERIFQKTEVKMSIEGVFSWLLFLPSRIDEKMPVANKYLGRFDNGELKYRGIAVRRKDIPAFIKQGQLEHLEVMRPGVTIKEVRSFHEKMHQIYLKYDELIESGQIPWRDLLVRKTVSKELDDYAVLNGTSLAMRQLRRNHIAVQPGEKVRFVVLQQESINPENRYIAEELATLRYEREIVPFDKTFYRRMWWQSFKELWCHFAPEGYFERMPDGQRWFAFV